MESVQILDTHLTSPTLSPSNVHAFITELCERIFLYEQNRFVKWDYVKHLEIEWPSCETNEFTRISRFMKSLRVILKPK